MESQNLHYLSLFLDQEIYLMPEDRDSLSKQADSQVLTESSVEQIPEEEVEEKLELEYQGGFEKGILVVFEGKELEKEHHDLLFNILNAVNCSLKDVALCSDMSLNLVSPDYISNMAPNKVIIFGNIHHDIISLKKKDYSILQEEGTEYLFADGLKTISEDKNLKRALWTALQVLFNITGK
ncbi:hypothetical protein [Indibacter alkaliphilus]|nr:hypothetical protein [Indibacter alkaliphilus]